MTLYLPKQKDKKKKIGQLIEIRTPGCAESQARDRMQSATSELSNQDWTVQVSVRY